MAFEPTHILHCNGLYVKTPCLTRWTFEDKDSRLPAFDCISSSSWHMNFVVREWWTTQMVSDALSIADAASDIANTGHAAWQSLHKAADLSMCYGCRNTSERALLLHRPCRTLLIKDNMKFTLDCSVPA